MATGTEQRVHTITAEPLRAESFDPFGWILTTEGQERLPIDLYDRANDVFRPSPLESDRPVEFLVVRSRLRPFRAVWLERHLQLTQSFIPLDAQPFVSILAPADAPLVDDVPALDAIRAFIVPGGTGITIRRGVWHEPPLPLVDRSVQIVTSHADLTAGLGATLNERHEIAELDVDKRDVTERTGVVVRIAMPS